MERRSWPASRLHDAQAASGGRPTETVEPVELAFWQSVEGSDDPQEYRAYLDQFPEGAFVALAEARLNGASNSSRSADRTVELEFWNSIKDSDVRENFEAYLEKYPEGEFRSLAEIKLKGPPEAAGTDRK